MSTRASSLNNYTATGITREIESRYDMVKLVASKLYEIELVANSDISELVQVLTEALDFSGIQVVTGDTANWDSINKILTVPTVKGDKGDKGDTGNNGVNNYIHVAYADTSLGDGFSTISVGKQYIGIIVSDNSIQPTNQSLYSWIKYIGSNGIDGINGIDGQRGIDGRSGYNGVTPIHQFSFDSNGNLYVEVIGYEDVNTGSLPNDSDEEW